MSEILLKVLTGEVGISIGLAQEILDNCTKPQIDAAVEYVQSVKKGPTGRNNRIDNWDKYVLMMTTAFRTYDEVGKKKPYKKATQNVKSASMEQINSFLRR